MIIEKMIINDLEKINLEEFDDFWNQNILERELKNPNSLYFVAKEEEEIVGFIGISINIDFNEILNIVVKKSCRNQGIGKLLLEKIIEETKKQKKEKIYLEVNEKNSNAIKLYENSGFETVGIRKKYYNNVDDALLMDLILKK